MSKNPFVDEEDDLQEQEAEQKVREEKGEIAVNADDEDDDGEREEAEAAPKSRSDKRNSRWREHTERATRAEEEARAARAQLDQERAATQRLLLEQQNLILNQQQGHAGSQPDPLEAEKKDIRANQTMLFERYQQLQENRQVTPDIEAQFRSKAERYQDRLSEIAAEQVAKRRDDAQRANQPDPTIAAIQNHVKLNYPDVLANRNARTYADATYFQLLALGEPPGLQTVTKAIEKARRAFRMPGATPERPAPTATDKRRFAGVEAGAGGSRGPTASAKSIVMDKATQRMAREMYPQMDPAKAYQTWANKVGKKLNQKDT